MDNDVIDIAIALLLLASSVSLLVRQDYFNTVFMFVLALMTMYTAYKRKVEG